MKRTTAIDNAEYVVYYEKKGKRGKTTVKGAGIEKLCNGLDKSGYTVIDVK